MRQWPRHENQRILNSRPNELLEADLPETVSATAARTPLSTRAGFRMTVVDKVPQTNTIPYSPSILSPQALPTL
eukprot:4146139-Karenia_brevis.AAC.1